MKLREGFITHDTDGEQIMVAAGNTHFPGLVRSNRTAACIVELLKSETTEEQLVEALLAKYEVSRETAEMDMERILDSLRSIGALDE